MKIFLKNSGLACALFLSAAILLLLLAACKSAVVSCETFAEMDDPRAGLETTGWEETGDGLHVSFVSVDEKYPKSFAPVLDIVKTHTLTGWRAERVSAQVLIWTAGDVPSVKVEVGQFSRKSAKLPVGISQARFVRYVMTDEFASGCGYRKPEDFASSLAPDMLDDLGCMDISARTVRPVWITVDIPRDAFPGLYTAKVKVTPAKGKSRQLELSLDVIDRTLPESSQWTYHLDLWQHPAAVARIEGVELWSEAHFEAMRPLMEMLADTGQKVITATLNLDPWNNQSYDAYADMITWTRLGEDRWEYDYTIFDKWVSFMLDIGVGGMINCYSMLPWNNMLHYTDKMTGEQVRVKADPGTPRFEEMWVPFLGSFVEHLREKGWLGITNIAMDERSPGHMDITMALLAEVAPELGVALADNHKSYEKFTGVRDLCTGIDNPVLRGDIQARQERGLATTYYVCCAHPFPNFFTFSHSAEPVYAGWYACANGYDGILHWSYNSWVEDPLRDSRFRTWPAGDTYMVYPGGRSSIRFERLREGVQDVEKMRILRSEQVPGLEELERQLVKFSSTAPDPSWPEQLAAAKELLNDISR